LGWHEEGTGLTKKDWNQYYALLGEMEHSELEALHLYRALLVEQELWDEFVYKWATVAERLKQESLH